MPGEGQFVGPVRASPGRTIVTEADTAVPASTTVPLPTSPLPVGDTKRVTVQNVSADSTTVVRVRELNAASGAGSGVALTQYGSVSFGGADGAVADLEVENMDGGNAAAVAMVWERL